MTLASGTSAGRGAVREELGAVLLPGIDSTGVVSVDATCVAVRAWVLYQQDHQQVGAALDGASAWSQLIVLVSDEADVSSALQGLEMIYVPYRHTCREQRSCTGKG